MSFRIEEKIPLSKSDSFIAFENFMDIGFKELHPEREIHSIYFDTYSYYVFADSEEGVLPRKKIRIRSYPNDTNKIYKLETKISSIEGRFKKTQNLSEKERLNYIENSYFDNLYGDMYACCKVQYNRQYFIKDGIRITYDNNIKYSQVNESTGISVFENKCVFEIKTDYKKNQDFINNLIPFPRARFSKFSEAIKLLGLC